MDREREMSENMDDLGSDVDSKDLIDVSDENLIDVSGDSTLEKNSEDNAVLKDNYPKNLSTLAIQIRQANEAGGVLNLDCDYVYNNSTDYSKCLLIEKDIIINGNGHYR